MAFLCIFYILPADQAVEFYLLQCFSFLINIKKTNFQDLLDSRERSSSACSLRTLNRRPVDFPNVGLSFCFETYNSNIITQTRVNPKMFAGC